MPHAGPRAVTSGHACLCCERRQSVTLPFPLRGLMLPAKLPAAAASTSSTSSTLPAAKAIAAKELIFAGGGDGKICIFVMNDHLAPALRRVGPLHRAHKHMSDGAHINEYLIFNFISQSTGTVRGPLALPYMIEIELREGVRLRGATSGARDG